MVPESHYWPIYAYPPCSETTHPVTGDGSCNPETCNDDNSCTGNRYSENQGYGSYAEEYLGILNEPYGSNQADWTGNNTLAIWETEIAGEIQKLATAKNVTVDDIKGTVFHFYQKKIKVKVK